MMNKAILFVVTACCLLKNCNTVHGEVSDDVEGVNKRGSPGGMWFGPRLGKRSNDFLSDPNLAPLHQLLLEAMAMQPSDYNPNAYGSKRRLTPRLGRELQTPESNANRQRLAGDVSSESDNSDNYIHGIIERAVDEVRKTISNGPPFIPRLGRNLYDFYGMPAFEDGASRIVRSVDRKPTSRKSSKA